MTPTRYRFVVAPRLRAMKCCLALIGRFQPNYDEVTFQSAHLKPPQPFSRLRSMTWKSSVFAIANGRCFYSNQLNFSNIYPLSAGAASPFPLALSLSGPVSRIRTPSAIAQGVPVIETPSPLENLCACEIGRAPGRERAEI